MRLRHFLLSAATMVAVFGPSSRAQSADVGGQEPVADIVVTRRLDAARQEIQPSLGATSYDFNRPSLDAIPQGDLAPLQSVLLQAPGVAADSYGQVHVRDEHANVQFRLDGVQLPEGLSVFGQSLESRFAHSISFVTGALPAEFGFNHAAVVDIATKSGTTDPGGAISVYGGSRGVVQPSLDYGGRSGPLDWFVTGELLRTNLGIENPANTFNAVHDASDQVRGFAHVAWLLDDDTRVSLLAGAFHADYQIPNRGGESPGLGLSVNGAADFASAALSEHQRELSDFGVLSLQKHVGDVDVQSSVFTRYSSLRFSPDPLGDLLFTGIAQTASRSDWATGTQTDASWKAADDHTLRAGFRVQIERVIDDSVSSVLPVDDTGARTSDTPLSIAAKSARTGALYGLYVQDEWRVLPDVTVNYGVRFDVVDEYAHEREASPRVNVVWQAAPATTVHAGYARTFTPPPFELVSAATIGRFAGTTAASEVAQDSIARAERAHYFDAGASQVVIPGLTLGVDAYFKLSRNLIDEGQFGSPILLTAFNYERGQQQGVELSATYDHGPWSLYSNLAYARGVGRKITSAQFNFSQADLDYISQHFIHLDHDQRWTGSAGAAYTLAADSSHPARLSADVAIESGLRAGGSTPNGAALPGYYAINLSGAQTLRLLPIGPTELRLDVLNLLDRRYIIRDGTGVGVGAPQYGLRRAILAGATQRF